MIGILVLLLFLALLGGAAAVVTALWNKVRVLERRLTQLEGQLALRVENEAAR